jgi:hypothetical protein
MTENMLRSKISALAIKEVKLTLTKLAQNSKILGKLKKNGNNRYETDNGFC